MQWMRWRPLRTAGVTSRSAAKPGAPKSRSSCMTPGRDCQRICGQAVHAICHDKVAWRWNWPCDRPDHRRSARWHHGARNSPVGGAIFTLTLPARDAQEVQPVLPEYVRHRERITEHLNLTASRRSMLLNRWHLSNSCKQRFRSYPARRSGSSFSERRSTCQPNSSARFITPRAAARRIANGGPISSSWISCISTRRSPIRWEPRSTTRKSSRASTSSR